jgi:4-hydroxybenzoate polyprenyltransferase
MQTPATVSVADAKRGNWVDRFAPEWLRPYARLARWDRPIGFWLLFWPCAFALALAFVRFPAAGFDWRALGLSFVGAIAMRGAGCTLNDLVDQDIDALVERTRSRPLPSGQVRRRDAALFLLGQLVVGLLILLQFNMTTIIAGAASLVLIAIYPFMKRITWWPQFFLGLAFSWGALIGYTAEVDTIGPAAVVLYTGTILWVIGYDTIYALQDVEDDALIGVKSTARLFGAHVKAMVALFYAGAVGLWAVAALLAGASALSLALLAVPAAGLAWQVVTLDAGVPDNPRVRFYANHYRGIGLAITLALLAGAWG